MPPLETWLLVSLARETSAMPVAVENLVFVSSD